MSLIHDFTEILKPLFRVSIYIIDKKLLFLLDPIRELTHLRHELVGSVSKAEMLYKTNLVAMVGGGKKPRFPDNVVMVYDDRQQEFVLELSLPESVLSVRLKRDKLVAVCRSEIHVFSFPNRCQNLFKVTTRDNPRGLCELSSIRSGAVETSIGNILFFLLLLLAAAKVCQLM